LFSGSFPTASKLTLPIWAHTAKLTFNHTKEEKSVQNIGVYDKSIIDCAFREDLRKKKIPDAIGGCKGFHPSLTTNGMCYTFNGKSPSALWKSSKMISTFATLFKSNSTEDKVFGGSRTVQGN
jgi:hypothetical protein